MQDETLLLHPIAHIYTDFPEKFGIPRQAGRAAALPGRIVFEPQYRDPEALRGIEGFSHLWLVFDFSLAHREGFSPTVRPPRLGGNQRVGVFASRSPYRPNPLGLSAVKLERVEKTAGEGTVLYVSGADLVSGTPILDIKPYLPFADAIPDARDGYAGAHVTHKLRVVFGEGVGEGVERELLDRLTDCLKEDPRPSYQEDGREYGMRFSDRDVRFTVTGDTLTVIALTPHQNT